MTLFGHYPWEAVDIAGKTAAITGGTTGIGRAIKLEYLRQGVNVAVNHLGLSKDEPLRKSLLEEARRIRSEAPEGAPIGELLEIAGDVTNPKTGEALVAEAVDRWGALDIFVANAGIFKAAKFLEIEKQLFDTSMQVNVNGAFYSCQAAARQMVKQGNGGSIIAISSISALQGGGLQVHYTPTKAAILSMTQSMAIALAKDRIRVNALLPGTIHTQLADSDMANEEKLKYLKQRIPWGRVGKPEDVAGPAVFLATDQLSGFVTGSQLLVDGGMYASSQIGNKAARPSTTDEVPTGLQLEDRSSDDSKSVAGMEAINLGASPCDKIKHSEQSQQSQQIDGLRRLSAMLSQASESVSDHSLILPENSIQPARAGTAAGSSMDGRQMDGYNVELPQRSIMLQSGDGAASFTSIHPSMYDIVSPTDVPIDPPSLSYNYANTPDSGIGRSGESLTLRWLDLLIGDATVNYGPIPEYPYGANGFNVFGNSVAQTPEPPEDDDASPTDAQTDKSTVISHNPYLLERISCMGDQLRQKEQGWQAMDPIDLQPNEHILFRHFIERISLWMDLFEPQRPFGTLVPQLALHNVGLMNAILALSARHLHIIKDSSPVYATGFQPNPNDTINYYYKTLHYSQQAMQYDTYQTSLELLTSAIIISSYEMLDGSSTDWEKHLKGVFWIQRSQVIHGDSGGLRQAIWWAWICQDVWAAFREKRKPFTFWRPTRLLAHLSPCELAARAVYNFAHVVGFCAKEEAPADAKHTAARTREADCILQFLQQWRTHLTAEFEPLPLPDAEGKPFPSVWIQPAIFGMRGLNANLLLLANTAVPTSTLARRIQRVPRSATDLEKMGEDRLWDRADMYGIRVKRHVIAMCIYSWNGY
ncbi:hypothetical protein G7046_g3010 [Stylonectria norvegica]|nr:hypothetical protein G7046_g3010 [Stylonectria norvegica]